MTASPNSGEMILYDRAEVPLEDGSYRLTTETNVTDTPGFSQQHYFDVVGPRFSIPKVMIAGCFPPDKSHGSFQDDLPHIVLARRSLPWEREPDPGHLVAAPAVHAGDPPAIGGTPPWMALLVFDESECTLLRDIPLQQAVPPAVYARLGNPAGVLCDAVEAKADLVAAIMPSIEELKLLAHVRQVNVNDRELNAAGGDGFYAVVVANRLPTPGVRSRAVLVSLEERSDLVPSDPLPVAPPPPIGTSVTDTIGDMQASARMAAAPFDVSAEIIATAAGRDIGFQPTTPRPRDFDAGGTFLSELWMNQWYQAINLASPKVRLVALANWQFACEGKGTFRELMQGLDDAMFGTLAETGHPALTDSGHLKLTLQDRAGAPEDVWYRGPLVPAQLSRDPLGPYHCADQARRVTPDTGTEDITYAAAFEVGRLLAIADKRFAQCAAGWRREAFKQSARGSTLQVLTARAGLGFAQNQLHMPMTGVFSAQAASSLTQSALPIADAYGLAKIASAPGLQPNMIATAWPGVTQLNAAEMLGAGAYTLGATVSLPEATVNTTVTFNGVLGDSAGLARLTQARQQILDNATIQLGGE